MDAAPDSRARMPIAEDLDDPEQLRAALLDRDRRIVRLRAELVSLERWVQQLQAQASDLVETADNARAGVDFLLGSVPDLLEPEVRELREAVADDARASRAGASASTGAGDGDRDGAPGRGMRQRLSLVTLGVADLASSCAFYERLGWQAGNDWRAQDVAFFQCGGMVLALWDRTQLAADAGLAHAADPGAVVLAHNVGSPHEVDAVIAAADAAGATIVRAGAPTSWGGYGALFRDPDGHAWEVAHNPHWTLQADGTVRL